MRIYVPATLLIAASFFAQQAGSAATPAGCGLDKVQTIGELQAILSVLSGGRRAVGGDTFFKGRSALGSVGFAFRNVLLRWRRCRPSDAFRRRRIASAYKAHESFFVPLL